MPRLELDALCDVGSNHLKTYHPQKWTAPLGYRIVERLAIILALLLALTFYNIWAEDHPIRVVGFPIGLSPRTMQGLGSVQNLWDFFFVLGFPIGLSPRTMQGLGSVQNLWFFLFCTWFPHRLESEDHARSWLCPKLVIFSFFVLGFPTGLSPRTMQGLGSVQNL